MELDEAIRKRKSVRSFQQRKVDFKVILDALDAANQGPFAGNMNNLRFVIVENKGTIDDIAKHANQIWISNADAVIVACSEELHIEDVYGERGRIYSRQQSGAAIQTILLKLTEAGIGSCWVGAYKDEAIKNALGIPEHINIEAIIPIGYEKKPAKGEEKKQHKKEVASTIYWEAWHTSRRPTLFREPPMRNPNQTF